MIAEALGPLTEVRSNLLTFMVEPGPLSQVFARPRDIRLGCLLRRALTSSLFLASLMGLEGCRAQQPWPLWDAYTARFLDGQGRVIDRSTNDRTTSEGESYAMFFALVDNDRPRFDKLLTWTEGNLAQGDVTQHLPAWNWGRNAAGEWKTVDQNSAADADLWMAYTLTEAGRLWHEPRYAQLGETMAARIAHDEVIVLPGLGTTVAPGAHGFHTENGTYVLNPSYLPPFILARFAKAFPGGPWKSILNSLPMLLGGDVAHGYVMDWLAYDVTGLHPSPPPAQLSAGVRAAEAGGSYDAIRVYLWLGISDAGTPGLHSLLRELPAMASYLQTALIPPSNVDSSGKIVQVDASPGFSAAVIPYLLAVGAKEPARVQQVRLDATRDPATGLYGRSQEYYDQNLALFSTGFTEGRYRFDREGKLQVKWK